MNKKLWALMLLLPLLAFCGKKDKPEPDPDPQPEEKPEIVISGEKEFTLGCEGGSGTLTFTSNIDWTASADDSWLTVTPESGKASKSTVTLTFSCGQNPQLKGRSTYIVLSGYGAEKNIPCGFIHIPCLDCQEGLAPEVPTVKKEIAVRAVTAAAEVLIRQLQEAAGENERGGQDG